MAIFPLQKRGYTLHKNYNQRASLGEDHKEISLLYSVNFWRTKKKSILAWNAKKETFGHVLMFSED